MGMQQTYGGIARAISPLFFGWAFDTLGTSSPYFFASAFIVGTIFLTPHLTLVPQNPTLSTQPADNS
jgi:cyanate permease